jgi:hypothetical protein
MKRTFTILAVSFLCAFTAIAQPGVRYAQGVYFGVKAGASVNKILGVDTKQGVGAGYHFGLLGNFRITDKTSFQHELLYSVRNFNARPDTTAAYSSQMSYLDFPLLLNYHPNRQFHFYGGLQPSVLLYFKPLAFTDTPYDLNSAAVMEFSAIAGAGMVLDNNFLFGMRITAGLTQTFNTDLAAGNSFMLHGYVGYAINRKIKKKRK